MIQLNFVPIEHLTLDIFTKQLYRNPEHWISNEQDRHDSGNRKFPEMTRGRKPESHHTQKEPHPLLNY